VATTNLAPLTVIEPARALPSGEDSGGARGRPVVVCGLDGTLTRRHTLLPFLRRIAGTPAVVRAVAVSSRCCCTGRSNIRSPAVGGLSRRGDRRSATEATADPAPRATI
jgi:hypothetical protein